MLCHQGLAFLKFWRRCKLKRALGISIWFGIMALFWAGAPAVAIGFNAAFRPDYHVRDFGSEYEARLPPNRVYWHDYKPYRLDCPDAGNKRVVVLHTTEFEESPRDYLARAFPDCTGIERLDESWIPGFFHGILLGRW